MRAHLLTLAVALLVGCAASVTAQANLVRNPGFEEGQGPGADGWLGIQNVGQAACERSGVRPHAGGFAAKMVCKTGDVYARWVYREPALFTEVRRGDRLKLTFWYRASAALGDT